jgi:hypothetical protein
VHRLIETDTTQTTYQKETEMSKASKIAAFNVTAATAAELIEFYNANVEKQVKRFADRKTAEKRCQQIVDAAAMIAKATPAPKAEKPAKAEKVKYVAHSYVCPSCGATADQTGAGEEGTNMGDNYTFCHHCSTTYDNYTGKVHKAAAASAERAASISKSWQDPEVRAARIARHAVRVSGVEYTSMMQALKALHLSTTKMIKLRGQMVLNGKVTFEGHNFILVK